MRNIDKLLLQRIAETGNDPVGNRIGLRHLRATSVILQLRHPVPFQFRIRKDNTILIDQGYPYIGRLGIDLRRSLQITSRIADIIYKGSKLKLESIGNLLALFFQFDRISLYHFLILFQVRIYILLGQFRFQFLYERI